MDEKEYLSLEEVADKLGVTYQLIYKLVTTGELPAIRIGKLYRVSQVDLNAYLSTNRTTSAAGKKYECSYCHEVFSSRNSVKHSCQKDGCNEMICNDCWTRKQIHTCEKHTKQ